MQARYPLIQERHFDALDRYLNCGIRCGYFLNSVLENDLVTAVNSADGESLAALPQIVKFVYNELPSPCWGDKKKVNDWIEKQKEYARA